LVVVYGLKGHTSGSPSDYSHVENTAMDLPADYGGQDEKRIHSRAFRSNT